MRSPKQIVVRPDERFQAECDLRALSEAAKVKADPKRLARAQELAKEHVKITRKRG